MPTYRVGASTYCIQTLGYGANGSPSNVASQITGDFFGVPHVPMMLEYGRVIDVLTLILTARQYYGEQDTPGGGGTTDFTQNIDDTLALIDALTFDNQKLIADTLTLSDAISFGRAIAIADTLALADALSLQRDIHIADTASLADAMTFDQGKLIADAVALADAMTFDRAITIPDTAAIADAIAFGREILLTDTLAITDARELRLNGILITDVVATVIHRIINRYGIY